METLSRYMGWTFDYISQMLPCCVLTAAVFLALLPVRKKRLARLGLVSRPRREALLFLFVLFCGGLMALTLFPAGFWSALMAGHLPPEGWFACRGSGMYLRITLLSELTEGGAWTRFMLLGNAVAWPLYLRLRETHPLPQQKTLREEIREAAEKSGGKVVRKAPQEEPAGAARRSSPEEDAMLLYGDDGENAG